MKNQKSPKMPDSRWVYFVFNWGSPVACFTNAALSLAYCRLVSKNWGNPLPEGALKIVRYRPSVGLYKMKTEDITDTILKYVKQ